MFRLRDVIIAPSRLFEQLGNRTPWFDILLTASLVSGAAVWLLWSSDVGTRILARQKTDILESAKTRLTESQYASAVAQLDRDTPTPVGLARRAALGSFVSALLTAAVCLVFFSVAFLNNDVRYFQVLSVVSHASIIGSLELVFMCVVSYFGGDYYANGSLSEFLAIVPKASHGSWFEPLVRFDVLGLWWVAVLAIGLGRLFNRAWLLCALVIAIGPVALALLRFGFVSLISNLNARVLS